ncbi:hypothetical protein EDC01DRAFT_634816 [Geopyxis carbonaria]|nr:hypothetical protein EDC01DRAFT_634816 [Geopyxis carbonaria]
MSKQESHPTLIHLLNPQLHSLCLSLPQQQHSTMNRLRHSEQTSSIPSRWLESLRSIMRNHVVLQLGITAAICLSLSTIYNLGIRFEFGSIMWAVSIVTVIWNLVGLSISHFSDDGADLMGPARFGKFRPLFFLCWTIHARFSPTQYKFKYPLLYVGFPVSLKGSIGGSLFSVLPSQTEKEQLQQPEKKGKFTFFSVDPSSYFSPNLPFDQKVNDLLIRRGLDPADYPFIYFVTTPRFLGYSFNPVSYYYLYDSSQTLKATVLEVNNTFGESHIYILHADDPRNPKPRKGYNFAGTMEKDFHISPFNRRTGSYVIQVRDPVLEDEDGVNRVDVNMAVISTDGVKTMMARAYSTSAAFDLQNGSRWAGLWIAVSWGWNTFMALPQTFFEAWKIYRRGIKVYTRPEPKSDSGRRNASAAEIRMQGLFIKFLRHRIAQYRVPVKINLTMPKYDISSTIALEMVLTNCAAVPKDKVKQLDLQILNARFFQRLLSVQDPRQMFDLDHTRQDAVHQTFLVNDLALLTSLVSLRDPGCKLSYAQTSWQWKVLSWFRRRKTIQELDTASPSNHPATMHCDYHLSEVDKFFLRTAPEHAGKYMRTVLEAVVIDVFACGEAMHYDILISMGKAAATAAAVYTTWLLLK